MHDLLIIGGGIIGRLAALELSDRGRRVTLLDAGERIPSASWAGGGILSPLYPWRAPPAVTALTLEAVGRYRRLAERMSRAGVPEPELHQCGLLVEAPPDWYEAEQWAGTWGVELTRPEVDVVQSGLCFSEGLFFPELGAIRNPDLLHGLEQLLRRQGVDWRREEVTALHAGGDAYRVVTPQGEYRARELVVTAGKASADLLAALGFSLPLFPVKGEMLMYRARPGQLRTVVLTETGYLIPRRDGRVLAGSTLERGVDSTLPSRAAGERLHRRALTLWPELSGCPLEAQWAGVRPGCDSEIPWIGAVPGLPGVWVATGHYRNGLVSAPATAELLACLISGETPGVNPEPYDPARGSA